MKRLSILFCGALVNSVGTGLSAFALAIFMFDAYGTASSVVLVQLSAFAPIVLLAPVAGVLADRFDRRVMMAIGDGGSIGGLLIVMAAVSSERPGIGLVCGGIAASSCFAALTEPALRASVSDLVGPDEYVRASSMLQIASSARYLLSPFLAGMLLPAVGLRAILLLDASTCVVTVACSAAVHKAVGHQRGLAEESGFLAQLAAGWRAVASRSAVRRLVALMTCLTFAIGFVQTLVKPILLPHVPTSTMGTVETVMAVGMLAGAGLVGLMSGARPTTLLCAGLLTAAVSMILLPLRPAAWWAAATGFAFFAALALCNAGAEVIVRMAIPNERQARAWGAIGMVSQFGYIAAYIVAGPLADRVFEPLLRPGGGLAATVGKALGTGPGRGTALLVACVGALAFVLACVTISGRRALASTARPGRPPARPEAAPTTGAGASTAGSGARRMPEKADATDGKEAASC